MSEKVTARGEAVFVHPLCHPGPGKRGPNFTVAERARWIDVAIMKLDFSLDDIDQLWIDGALPSTLRQNKYNHVKVQLAGKSDSPFPPPFPVGDLLCSERPSPLQYAVTLMLTYLHSITPSPAVKDDNGWWSMPGSEIRAQIRIPLTAEAIAQIRQVEGDGYQYELDLKDIELANKTPSGPK